MGSPSEAPPAKQIEEAICAAEQRLKRSPTEDEVAAQLEIGLDEYHEWLVEIRGLNVGSLESATGEQGKDLLNYIPDRRKSAIHAARTFRTGADTGTGDREYSRNGADGLKSLL